MKIRMIAGIAASALVCGAAIVPVAGAAEIAPGAPMRLQPGNGEIPEGVPLEVYAAISCSQGVPGTVTLPDGSQKNVMVSVAHCLKGDESDGYETYPYVYAPLPEGYKLVAMAGPGEKSREGGSDNPFDRRHWFPEAPDWAIADVSPEAEMSRTADSVDQYGRRHGELVELTGVRDYRDLQEWEVSFDNFGQPICKDGQTTGRTCGIQFMRTRDRLWSLGTATSGDSGGVNFDPNNGEALGVSSESILGLVMSTQPVDIALEEAYGIPDGEVNKRFALPDSTAAHTPTTPYAEDSQRRDQWLEENTEQGPAEPVTFEDATDIAIHNTMDGVAEVHLQARDSVNLLSEDPTQVGQAAENMMNAALYAGEKAGETTQAYAEAFQTSLEEE